MQKFHKFSKTVFITVFFYALFQNAGCNTINYEQEPTTGKLELGKYIVNYEIDAKRSANDYHKDAQIVFFPLLKLNFDGSLVDDYINEIISDGKYLRISSNYNFDSSIRIAEQKFRNNFSFNQNSLFYMLPFKLNKSYFIRFYFNDFITDSGRNSVYLRSSIEYFHPKDTGNLPVNVWTGEAYFNFHKSIKKETCIDITIKKVFEYAFKNYSSSGKFHILDL